MQLNFFLKKPCLRRRSRPLHAAALATGCFLFLQASLIAQPAVDPERVTRQAIADLRFAAETFPDVAPDLEAVVDRLERSLTSPRGDAVFVDSCHVQPLPDGLDAFVEARQAVIRIEQLLKKDRLPPFVARTVRQVRGAVLEIDLFLADVALQEARALGEDPSAASQIAIAERQLANGLAERDEGKPEKALQAFRQAWEHAQLALPAEISGDRPRLNLQTPIDGALLHASPIDVSGRVQLATAGPVGPEDVSVLVNGIAAAVDNRSFQARSVELRPGLNAIVGVARATTGGVGVACLAVRLDTTPRPRVTAIAGDRQTAPIRTPLPLPLAVRVTDVEAQPVAGVPVVFRVVQGNGSLPGGGRGTVIPTDAAGEARTFFTLGDRAGIGVDRVRATAVDFPGEVIFSATATTTAPDSLQVVSGNAQRGGTGEPLAEPLVVVANDAGQNPVSGVPVTFTVVAGGGAVGGGDGAGGATSTVTTDANGRAAVPFTLGLEPGLDAHRVEARFAGLVSEAASFQASAFELGDPAATALSGVVLDNQGEPVPGVTLRVRDTALATTAEASGRFALTGVPVGELVLDLDGATAARPGVWTSLALDVRTLPGIDNALSRPVHILPLDTVNGRVVGGAEDVEITVPEVPGFKLTVPAGSATFPDGAPTGLVTVTPVHADKIPMSPGSGMQPRFIITVQPSGTTFDPPAPVSFPNVDGLAPGSVTEMFSFDHDLGEFISIGTGTVSEDGTVVRSDPGFGIVKAGWHCSAPPSGSGPSAAIDVNITSMAPIVIAKGGTDRLIEAEGKPPRDAEYSWQSSDTNIVALSPSGNGLCPGASRCDTQASPGQPGAATAKVTMTCTTTGESDMDQIEVLVVDSKIEEVVSEQLAGRECNKLPTPKPALNVPMLMGGIGGSDGALSVLTQIMPASAANKVRVGVRKPGTTNLLGDEPAMALPGKAVVTFTGDVAGQLLYEIVTGVDENDDGVLQETEVTDVFPEQVRLITQEDYDESKKNVDLQDIFLVGVAQDMLDVFMDRSSAPPGATASIRTISSSVPDHPLGKSWNTACSSPIQHFTFPPTSAVAMTVAASDTVEGFVKETLASTVRPIVQAFFSSPGSPDSNVFTGPWDWRGNPSFSDWILAGELGIAGAFGGVNVAGEILEVEVERGFFGGLNLVRIKYNGGFEDLYDFNYTSQVCRNAAVVQSGFPTLGGAGEIFTGEVELERDAECSINGFCFNF